MSDDRAGDKANRALQDGIASGIDTAGDLAAKAQTAGSTIRDAAIGTANQASDAASKAYRQGAQAADYVSRNTAEQPWVALLIAAAVGYGIALMIHGR